MAHYSAFSQYGVRLDSRVSTIDRLVKQAGSLLVDIDNGKGKKYRFSAPGVKAFRVIDQTNPNALDDDVTGFKEGHSIYIMQNSGYEADEKRQIGPTKPLLHYRVVLKYECLDVLVSSEPYVRELDDISADLGK